MRPGMRSRAPARADRATEYTTHAQMWGEPAWGMSPDLEFGADPVRQNAIGQLHCAGSGNRTFLAQVIPWASGVVKFTGSISGTVLTVSSITSAGPGFSVGQMVTWDTGGVEVNDYCTRSDIGANFRCDAKPSTVAANWTNIGGGTGSGTNWGSVSSEINMRNLDLNGDAEFITSFGTGTGGTGTYNLSSSNTKSARAMFARHPYANTDGGMAFGTVADPVNSGRYCHITRVTEEDPDASGQEGRKTMPRTEGTASGVMRYSDMLLNAWSVMVPTATREMYTGTYYTETAGVHDRTGWGHTATLIYQNKTGQPIQHAIWLCARGQYPTAETGPYFELQPGTCPSDDFQKMLINFPADTWIHFIQLQRHGVRAWSSGIRMANGRFSGADTWGMITNAGQVYMVVSGGDDESGTASTTAPTHTGLLSTDDVTLNGIRWRCLGPIGDISTDPACWVWAAIGDSAHSLVINDNPETNIGWPQTAQDDPNEINTQIGWYTMRKPLLFDVFGSGDSGYIDQSGLTSYPNSAWTASSDGVNVVSRTEKSLYWKGPWSARPVIANQYRTTLPSDALLTQWFNMMRSR
jgi:hypothetical protein